MFAYSASWCVSIPSWHVRCYYFFMTQHRLSILTMHMLYQLDAECRLDMFLAEVSRAYWILSATRQMTPLSCIMACSCTTRYACTVRQRVPICRLEVLHLVVTLYLVLVTVLYSAWCCTVSLSCMLGLACTPTSSVSSCCKQ